MTSSQVDSEGSNLGMDRQWQSNRARMFSASSDDSSGGPSVVPHQRAQLANTLVEHVSLLDTFTHPNAVRNTGIVCTIGKMCL